ncbi:hypothetical protein [Streptomyces sp. SA15]|uniref:hypothetical protein n=1 Tax=Streptomyces sp. SA15 TaxID=934019 RepID=UPI0015C890A5|nr:hypothetical protein [Streptomyces sp. SA15]
MRPGCGLPWALGTQGAPARPKSWKKIAAANDVHEHEQEHEAGKAHEAGHGH